MNKHKSNKIKENSDTVRHLIMGQITTTQNLFAIKEVRHAGQSQTQQYGGSGTGYGPTTLQWRHNGRDGVSNHQPRDCLHNRSFRRKSKKTSKVRVTGLCVGDSAVTITSAYNFVITSKFYVTYYVMAGRGFVIAKEVFHHRNCNILKLWEWLTIKLLNDDQQFFLFKFKYINKHLHSQKYFNH